MRDAKEGTYNGDTTYCTVNAYGECPYCDQCGVCHIDDPMEDCDDWGAFWESWEDWLAADDVDPDAPTDFSREEMWWATQTFGFNTEEARDYEDEE